MFDAQYLRPALRQNPPDILLGLLIDALGSNLCDFGDLEELCYLTDYL